jgi:hypothetical protein
MHRLGVNRKLSETGFGIAVRRMVPGVERKRRVITTPSGPLRTWEYVFPSLKACRSEFARLCGDPEQAEDAPDINWQKAEVKP